MRTFLFAALTGALTLTALPVDAEACINDMEKHRKPTNVHTFTVDIGLSDKPQLSPSINETALADALDAQTADLQSCYAQEHARLTSGAKAQVTLSLVVTPSGTVTESTILASSFRGEQFQTCVSRSAAKMNFGSLKSGKSETIHITLGFQAWRWETGSASPVDSPSRGRSAPAPPQTSPNES